jgi:hypothetical protein
VQCNGSGPINYITTEDTILPLDYRTAGGIGAQVRRAPFPVLEAMVKPL